MADPLTPNEQRTADRYTLLEDLRAIEEIYHSAMETVDSALKHVNRLKYGGGKDNRLMTSDLGLVVNLFERMIWSDRQLLVDRKVLFHEASNRILVGMTQKGGQDGEAHG